jgi:hypothetical protein
LPPLGGGSDWDIRREFAFGDQVISR